MCLLPWWPRERVIELAPANWHATVERADVREKLAANVFRQASLGELETKPEAVN